jgi:malonyl-CoA O-methyltransferase
VSLTSPLPVLDPLDAYALWSSSYPAHAHNPVMMAEERAMLALVPEVLRGRHVLDAGCGSGRYLMHALRRGASRITGVDLSPAMLGRAREALGELANGERADLRQGDIAAMPVPGSMADLTICGLTLGHLEELAPALAELRRATRPGGRILCSDVHPIGHALGWQRDFRAGGQRYAVRHTRHLYSHWHAACTSLGLAIERVEEPMLDAADIPPGAHFDPMALELPVALVFQLRRIA